MEKLNIRKSILSITSPGTHLTPNDSRNAARMTRQTNEELSEVCRNDPKHFGFFASLPLPSVSESIAEVDFAIDVLGAVGFAVMSNANGVYLGDVYLDPVWEKLNERKAIIFMHPTSCKFIGPGNASHDQTQIQTATPLPAYPRPMLEFMFDETRAVCNLLLSGTIAKYPNITYIMSHCGCALPSILDRVGGFAGAVSGGGEDQSGEYRRLLRERFYFDLAGFPFPNQIYGLLRVLGEGGEERLVYGSDYPFTPEAFAVKLGGVMDEGCERLFDGGQRSNVYEGNAKGLLGL